MTRVKQKFDPNLEAHLLNKYIGQAEHFHDEGRGRNLCNLLDFIRNIGNAWMRTVGRIRLHVLTFWSAYNAQTILRAGWNPPPAVIPQVVSPRAPAARQRGPADLVRFQSRRLESGRERIAQRPGSIADPGAVRPCIRMSVNTPVP